MKSRYFRFSEYGRPADVLELAEQALPEPGPGQALVKIHAIGLNRSELNYTLGRYVPAREFPSGLGQEAVGEIVALGPPAGIGPAPHAVVPLAVGARVALLPGRVDMCANGAYREAGVFDQSALAPVPDDFSDAEGAAYWMGILTMGGCLEMAGLSPGNTAGRKVLVTAAASSMGVITLQLAKAWGAETFATTRSAAKVAELEGLADHVIVCTDSDTLAAGVEAATGGSGVDVSLDPVGAAFYPGLVAATATGGCLVSYEMISGPVAELPIAKMMIADMSIHGFTIFRVYQRPGLLDALIDQGLRFADAVRPVIATTFPFEQAPAALEALERSRHVGKIVLEV